MKYLTRIGWRRLPLALALAFANPASSEETTNAPVAVAAAVQGVDTSAVAVVPAMDIVAPTAEPRTGSESNAAPVAVAAPANQVIEIKGATERPERSSVTPSETSSNLISVTLDNTPMQDIVRMFTRISGANIIAAASNLQGTVTVNLQDVEWKPALSAILDTHDLALVEKHPGSGVYSIVPKPMGAPEPLVVTTFPLRYASVSNVTAIVATLLPAGGSVAPYPSRNALVVRVTVASLGEVQKVLDAIDRPRQQVFIEAKFLELNDDAIKDLGIDWQVLSGYTIGADLGWNYNETRNTLQSQKDLSHEFNNHENIDTVNQLYNDDGQQFQQSVSPALGINPATGLPILGAPVVTPTRVVNDTLDSGKNISSDIENDFSKNINDVRTAVLSPAHFQVVLSALKQMNGVSIVSNPKIIVANEETAAIHIGQNEPNIRGTVTAGQQGQANTTTYQLDPLQPYFQFGITLDVTPTINTESNISVRINPTLSSFLSEKAAPDGNTFPITSTKTIKTLFSLESEKTAAIGGLTQTQDYDVENKIPMLGDIPFIGKYLFSHTHKERSQAETIIFVTVGLANPEHIATNDGFPEDTELAKRLILKQQAEKEKAKMEFDVQEHTPAATGTDRP